MTPYNKPRNVFDRRQLHFYRVLGTLPPNPNIHACAHLYASDRNSLFIVANHLDVGDTFTSMASLSHTVVFHTPFSKFLMHPDDGNEDAGVWFSKEDWTTRAAGGRGMHHCRMIGPGGVHVATSMQEGMVRIGKGKNAGEMLYEQTRKQKL